MCSHSWFIFSVNVYLIMWYFTILSYAYPYRIFTLIRLFDIFPSVKFRWDLHDILQTWIFLDYIIYYECVKPKVKFIYRYMPLLLFLQINDMFFIFTIHRIVTFLIETSCLLSYFMLVNHCIQKFHVYSTCCVKLMYLYVVLFYMV